MRWLYGLKIGQKIFLAFYILMLANIFLAAFTITRVNTVVAEYEELLDSTVIRQSHLTNTLSALTEMRLTAAYKALSFDSYQVQQTVDGLMAMYQAQDPVFLAELVANMHVISYGRLNQYEMDNLNNILEQFMAAYYFYRDYIITTIIYAVENNDNCALEYSIILGINTGREMAHLLEDVDKILTVLAYSHASDVAHFSTRTAGNIFATVAVISLLGILVCLLISNLITKPIHILREATDNITKGDLTYPICQYNDSEVGQLSKDIADMVNSISTLNKTIKVMDNLNAMVFILDENKNVVYANNNLLQAYKLEEQDINSAEIDELISFKLREFEQFKENISSLPDYVDFGVNSKDYFWDSLLCKWLEVTIASISWIDGSQVELYCFSDITDKKNEHDKRVEYEERLKTVALEAQAASLAKSAFLANTSHEIRTPMNSIIGYSELVLDDSDISGKTRRHLNNIYENAKWLLQIINDLLDVSKMESDKLELEIAPFDLQKVIQHSQSVIFPMAREKNLETQFYVESVLDKLVLGDSTRLTQVLLNLLSNAVKFTNHGIIKMSITLIGSTETSYTIHFEVRDSGIGMTEEQILRIFDTFTQADASITRVYGGSGLGLPIAKRLIELMGGRLEVESVLNIGSKFSFTLTFPIVKVDESEGTSGVMAGEIPKPMFDGEVLVFEDNDMNQDVICEHLIKVGLRPTIAVNGQIGFDIVKERKYSSKPPFGLIFMDIHMPVMDGLEAARLINQLETGTPIVAMTANIMINDEEIYRANGMDGVVGKPFTSQELWQCLLNYFTPIDWQEEKDKEVMQTEAEQQYAKILVQFADSNRNVCDTIAKHLAAGDVGQVFRLVHNLKTHAGMIEKPALRQIAAKIEASIRSNSSVSDADVAALRKEFNAVMHSIEPTLENVRKNMPDANFDIKMFSRLVSELKPLLESGDLRYLSYVDELYLVPGSSELVRCMQDINELAALEALLQLESTFGSEIDEE
ncbi:MAG: ATP-binding protein [Firmicutes bacterium]|nr:ATP-binding protein [Bacillota bacterium]